MVTLIGFIREHDFRITEFQRITFSNVNDAINEGKLKCLSRQWNFYQIKY